MSGPRQKGKAIELPSILFESESTRASRLGTPPVRKDRAAAVKPAGPTLPAKLWEDDRPVAPTKASSTSETKSPGEPTATGLDHGTPIRLWLLPRDPFSLMAHWDAFQQSLALRAAAWGPGDWRVRVCLEMAGGHQAAEASVDPHQPQVFVPVLHPGRRYVAELGYRPRSGGWHSAAFSEPAETPPEIATVPRNEPRMGRYAGNPAHSAPTIAPPSVSPTAPPSGGRTSFAEGSISTVSRPANSSGSRSSRDPIASASRPSRKTSPDLVDRLSRLIWREVGGVEIGSSGQLLQGTSGSRDDDDHADESTPGDHPSAGLEPDSLRYSQAIESITSDARLVPPPSKDFWFEVNAELIVHGRTVPSARVTLGGRPVVLRADGSFSFRFALPDGDFALPAVAVAASGDDWRSARLHFTRSTVREGEVGHHPLPPGLMPPVPEAVG